MAARGKPHDAVRELSDRIVEFLRGEGVDAQSATGGIPVVEESKMVLPMLLQKGQQDSAGSVLLLTADFVSMQKVALDCYTPAGAKIWKIKVSGGTGWKGASLLEERYHRGACRAIPREAGQEDR